MRVLKEIYEIFPTQIFKFNLKEELDLDSLAKIAQEHRDRNPEGYTKSNIGGWQRDVIGSEVEGEFDKLQDLQSECMQEILKNYNPCIYVRRNSWLNINNNTDLNLPHSHPLAQWSCCFYIKVPGGELVFQDPRVAREMSDHSLCVDEYHVPQEYFSPEEGDLVFFPSWLIHRVTPTNKPEDRITLATNYEVFKDADFDSEDI